MGFFILLLFIAVPIVEISVFIQVGDIIGLWPTIAIVVLTALIGTAMLRQQGLSTLMSAQTAMNEGRLPASELFDGVCLLLAGALLLTPGFVTDSIGFLLFLPPFRALLRNWGANVIKNSGSVRFQSFNEAGMRQPPHGSEYPHSHPTDQHSTIIDADFEEVKSNPDSPWAENETKAKD